MWRHDVSVSVLVRVLTRRPEKDGCGLRLERDSPRDQLVVTLFLLTVFGLLLGAGIKGKMEKAGLEPRFNWTAGRELWEVGCRPLYGRVVSVLGFTFVGLHRDSYRADVQKSLGLGCGTCSDVGMVVGGTSTILCRRRPHSEATDSTEVLHVLYTS